MPTTPPLRRLPRAVLVLLAAFLSAAGARAGDWPGWRGARQDSTASANGRLQLPAGQRLKVAWRSPLGPGYSSVSVAGGRAVTLFSDGTSDYVAAFDSKSGQELWRQRIADTFVGVDGAHNGPRSTPYIDGDRVVALGPKGHLLMLDTADGRLVWSVHLADDLGGKAPDYGVASSPAVEGDVVLVATGNEEGGFSGLRREDGKLLWTTGAAVVQYQSPLVVDLDGGRQLLAAARGHLWGLDPATGEKLWGYEHDGGSGRTNPIVIPPWSLVFDHTGTDATRLRLAKDDGKWTPEEVWQSMAFSAYTAPVHHDGYLYGYRERFLLALDAASGKVVWKSRPPGPGFLILVDDRLVIGTRKGTLHVAPASPEGYQEIASLDVLGDVSWTPPSFAEGRIYMRGMSEIAAVEVVDEVAVAREKPAPSAEGYPPEGSGFAAFLHQVEAAEDKSARIDGFLAGQKSFPIVEGDDLVHFVYRGDATDVGLWGDMFLYAPWHYVREERALHRLAGTDLFYYSLRLPSDGRFEYQLSIDFENRADPLNPVSEEDRSVLVMPGFEEASSADDITGRIESFEVESEKLGASRRVDVYLPPGYDGSGEPYPAVYVNEGNAAAEQGKILQAADRLMKDGARSFVVVLIHEAPGYFQADFLRRREEYMAMVVEEVMPRVEASYRVRRDASGRGMLSTMQSGIIPLMIPFHHPGVFGRVAMRSAYLEPEDAAALRERIRGSEQVSTAFYVGYGRYDWRSDEHNFNSPEEHRRIAETLKEGGYEVRLRAFNEGMRWGSWRHHLGEMLDFLATSPKR